VTRLEELRQERYVRVVHPAHERRGACVIAENRLCLDRVWVRDTVLRSFAFERRCCLCNTFWVPATGWRPLLAQPDNPWMCEACQKFLPVFDPQDPGVFDE
jgi:hypothetical protein